MAAPPRGRGGPFSNRVPAVNSLIACLKAVWMEAVCQRKEEPILPEQQDTMERRRQSAKLAGFSPNRSHDGHAGSRSRTGPACRPVERLRQLLVEVGADIGQMKPMPSRCVVLYMRRTSFKPLAVIIVAMARPAMPIAQCACSDRRFAPRLNARGPRAESYRTWIGN
jgi:hypothetical protein